MRELAAIFAASYQDYFVPFAMDEPTLAYMVDAFDLDLPHSLVAVEGGVAVGLGNSPERAWIGGVGVVPERRGGASSRYKVSSPAMRPPSSASTVSAWIGAGRR